MLKVDSSCVPLSSWALRSHPPTPQVSKNFGQRLFSRDLRFLQAGDGRFALFLSPEAKVWASFWCFVVPEGLLLLTETAQKESLKELIERYHFSETFDLVEGPAWLSRFRANQSDSELHSGSARMAPTLNRAEANFRGFAVTMQMMEPLPAEAAQDSALQDSPFHDSPIRVQSGYPLFGVDYDAQTLVFDLGFEEFCDSNKGCYIGQEIVERVRSRGGQGPRQLLGLESAQPLVLGTELFVMKGDSRLSARVGSWVQCDPYLWVGLAVGSRGLAVGDIVYASPADLEGQHAKITRIFKA